MEVEIMAKVEKSIRISAPVEKIFEYVSDPANLPEIWPSFIEAKNVEKVSTGGYEFGWVYKMAGMRFEGSSTPTEWATNRRIVYRNTGNIPSTITWTFESERDATKVTFQSEYTVPVPLLGKLAEVFILRQNEHEAEALLANLKVRMES
jgi:uncharacterized membrane protein